jgi:hypothetical protein
MYIYAAHSKYELKDRSLFLSLTTKISYSVSSTDLIIRGETQCALFTLFALQKFDDKYIKEEWAVSAILETVPTVYIQNGLYILYTKW